MASEKQHLRLRDTVSIIVGIVIGVGIFETAPLIFYSTGSPWMAIFAWALGGLLTLIGCFCYAELASAYPRSGGDYNYLSRAYGNWAGFMFGWMQMIIIATGGIGMMAFVFANYASVLWGFSSTSAVYLAALAVSVLSLTNIAGVLLGKLLQNVLTAMKVLGLLGVIMVGLLYAGQGNWDTPAGEASGGGAFGLAMILILYCYGGWNDAALVAAEQSDRRRNIPRALIIGTLLITLLYLLINAAYLFALNFEGAASSRAIASEVLAKPFGERGGRIMSLLVVVSALGAINAQIYTSARIHSRLGEDFRSLRWLAWWSPRGGSPIPALVSQMVITLTLIFLVGSPRGKAIVDQCLDSVGFGAIAWEGYGGFETLLRCSAPFFWLFFLMTGLALFILRFRDKATERPFRVPFYPITPMLFCLTSLYMLYSSATYAGSLILIGGVPLIAGFLLYVLYIQRQYVPNT